MPAPQNSDAENCQLPMAVDISVSGSLNEPMEFQVGKPGSQIVLSFPTEMKQPLGEQMIADR
eukprot:7372484-Lingulodinium_polyedra.AAC.1